MENTIVIVGRSEWINTRVEDLYTLLELFPTIGINNISPKIEPTCTMVIDYHAINKVVSNINNNKLKTTIFTGYNNSEFIPPNIPAKIINYTTINRIFEWSTSSDVLPYCGFTHDLAITYSIKCGFKNIILFGACDFTNTHFDNNEKFQYSPKLRNNSLYFIENVCTKYSNIYTMNNDSALQVPRITMKEVYERYNGKR